MSLHELGLQTPEYWQAYLGITILDPDGWREVGAPRWDEPITMHEFHRRMSVSTIMMKPQENS